ncbi:hypothetical protein UPYG_G00049150 [Umbra pygmaea]|uniref:C-type lectin domain-containing protein n=1 Tax=Umbra pygmaea TaxID=75934 RepID=A0ABD0XTL4_UMBPY
MSGASQQQTTPSSAQYYSRSEMVHYTVFENRSEKMSEDIYENPIQFEDNQPYKIQTIDIDDKIYANQSSIKPAKNNGFTAQNSVWKRRFTAAVFLGMLAVLLGGILGLLLNHKNQMTSCNTLAKEKKQLQNSYNNLTNERDQLQTSYNSLTKEREQQQTSYNSLTTDREQIRTRCNSLTKERDQLQTRYNSLTKERDQLQTRYNSLTKERDQLQTRYNTLNKECPDGWLLLGRRCYYVSTEEKTWAESRQYCKNRGADLVSINSPAEQKFVNWMCGYKEYIWIGLTDSGIKGNWKWVDGTPLTAAYWASGEPDNEKDEDCAYFYSTSSDSGAWWDYTCSYEYRWICEK